MYLYNFRYSLRGNYIETIPLEPFHVLRQLDRLDLGENFLTSLPPIMFNGTLTINDLNLEYNYIERLEDSAFISLQPRRLYLGHNRISYIDPKTFNGVELLVELVDLEANKLNEVSEVIIHHYTYYCLMKLASEMLHDLLDSWNKKSIVSIFGYFDFFLFPCPHKMATYICLIGRANFFILFSLYMGKILY